MRTVRVDVRVQSERELKVVWDDDGAWFPYCISRKAVEDCAKEIRRSLRELVDAALRNCLPSSGRILRDIAKHGALLHTALFTRTRGETDPERVRMHLNRSQEPFRLRVTISDSIFVPWGLLYVGDTDKLPDNLPSNPAMIWETYRGFWCLARELTTLYDRIQPDDDGPGDSSKKEMVRVINPDTYKTAMFPLAASPEQGFLSWLKIQYGEPLTSSLALKKQWAEKKLQTKLLYFYCHASASKLALGEDEKIEASHLFLLLSDGPLRPPGSSKCLLFINGCSTAVGATSGDFMFSASQEGLCGFVGTETDIPDIFALRFSLGLLHLLFHKGIRLDEAMQRMHRDHFPLSLVYGLYAHPGFRMPQDNAPDIVAPVHRNFSFDQVGTNRLEDFNVD